MADQPPEARFNKVIRTGAAAQPLFPMFIETVEQAIDGVQELPRIKLLADRWQMTSQALWAAVDFPDDRIRLAVAGAALRAALQSEGWLSDTPLA